MSEAASEPLAAQSSAAAGHRRKFYVLAGASLLAVLLGAMPGENHANLFAWDMMLLSGFITLLAG
ncbi:MAG: hypothetical protein ACRD8O_16870, partial [Bryobacteraceae bacterium]